MPAAITLAGALLLSSAFPLAQYCAKNIRVANAPGFNLLAHHSFSLIVEWVFAGKKQQAAREGGRDQVGRRASGREFPNR
jgi:hypothetical protein